MIGLPFAGDGLVHAGLLGLGILAALLFYAFAYEIVFHLAAFALTWRFRDRLPSPGDLFIGVEYVRGNEVLWLRTSGPQWFLLVILPLPFWRMLRVFGKPLRPKLERRVT